MGVDDGAHRQRSEVESPSAIRLGYPLSFGHHTILPARYQLQPVPFNVTGHAHSLMLMMLCVAVQAHDSDS